MSPASRSKPKDKSSAKAAKDQQKSTSKAAAAGSTGNSAPASAYNPLLGTFHTLDTVPQISSPPSHSNGRFRNIDETDEHSGSSVGTGAEYDSVSNNDSCSGESEDQKEKLTGTTHKQEAIPGSDNDKREKIRQKNERKHQRQRERRAQELHERCSGYLMSRKLEALVQQVMAMGISREGATMALIVNEGRIEEAVAWFFDEGEKAAQQKDSNVGGTNLKIDITEELSRITEMEIKFKCTKQEVERAVVACEGDLEKASENLKTQKQEPPVSPPKTEETSEPPVVSGSKVAAISVAQNPMRPQAKATSSVTIQQRRDERDFNYAKATPIVLASPDSASRNLQALRRNQQKPEWARPQATTPPAAEKRWPNSGSASSVPYSLAPPLQVSPTPKPEARYVVAGNEVKNLPTVREPVIMMQRPQSINAKQNNNTNLPAATSISASPPGPAAGWHPNSVQSVELMKSNSGLPFAPSTRNLNPTNNLTSHQFYQQPHYQPFVPSGSVDSAAAATGWGGGSGSGTWGSAGIQSPSSLAVPSSLGLFSGWGGSGSSSPIDWSTGSSMQQCDYTNIDWTLESTSALGVSSKPNDWWMGLASLVKNSRMYDSWSLANQPGSNPSMMTTNPASSNGGSVYSGGLQEGVATLTGTSSQVSSSSTSPSTSTSVGQQQQEWTSPFAGKDLFSIPRQFVTSPSL